MTTNTSTTDKAPASDKSAKIHEGDASLTAISSKVTSDIAGSMHLANSIQAEILKSAAATATKLYGWLDLDEAKAPDVVSQVKPQADSLKPAGSEEVTKRDAAANRDTVSAIKNITYDYDQTGKTIANVQSVNYADGSSFKFDQPDSKVGTYENPQKKVSCLMIKQDDGTFAGYLSHRVGGGKWSSDQVVDANLIINREGRLDVIRPDDQNAQDFSYRDSVGADGPKRIPLIRDALNNGDYRQISEELQKLARNLPPTQFQELVQKEINAEGAAGSKSPLTMTADVNGKIKIQAPGKSGTPFDKKSVIVYDSEQSNPTSDLQVIGITPQNIGEFRTELAKTQVQNHHNVQIQTTEADPPAYKVRFVPVDDLSGTDPEATHNPFTVPTRIERLVAGDVSKVFNAVPDKPNPNDTAAVKSQLEEECLSFSMKNTNLVPLQAGVDVSESAKKTWPQEIKLIKSLQDVITANENKGNPDQKISMADLASRALNACDGDKTLALLTLANFSKNVACIERRQVDNNTNNNPAYANNKDYRDFFDAYNDNKGPGSDGSTGIDKIFQHLQGFEDPNSTTPYNKEGAIYHFWGAAYVNHVLGPAFAETAVRGEMFVNGHNPVEYGGGRVGASMEIPLMLYPPSKRQHR